MTFALEHRQRVGERGRATFGGDEFDAFEVVAAAPERDALMRGTKVLIVWQEAAVNGPKRSDLRSMHHRTSGGSSETEMKRSSP